MACPEKDPVVERSRNHIRASGVACLIDRLRLLFISTPLNERDPILFVGVNSVAGGHKQGGEVVSGGGVFARSPRIEPVFGIEATA